MVENALATADGKGPETGIIEKPKAISTIGDLLKARRGHLAQVCTKYLDPDKLLKMIATQLTRTPKLAKCSPMSVLQAAMTCAELGLAPGVLGNVYLIPYDNNKERITECQLIVGYRGFITLAGRAGIDVSAHVVYRQDEFTYDTMADPPISHKPRLDIEPKDSEIVGAYMVAKLPDRAIPRVEWMTKGQIDKIRSRSRASGSGPWVTDYSEMCKKTVIRRGCKTLPLTPDLEEALGKADSVEFDNQNSDVIDQSLNNAQDRNSDAARSAVDGANAALAGGEEPEPATVAADVAKAAADLDARRAVVNAGTASTDPLANASPNKPDDGTDAAELQRRVDANAPAPDSLLPGAGEPTTKGRGTRR